MDRNSQICPFPPHPAPSELKGIKNTAANTPLNVALAYLLHLSCFLATFRGMGSRHRKTRPVHDFSDRSTRNIGKSKVNTLRQWHPICTRHVLWCAPRMHWCAHAPTDCWSKSKQKQWVSCLPAFKCPCSRVSFGGNQLRPRAPSTRIDLYRNAIVTTFSRKVESPDTNQIWM